MSELKNSIKYNPMFPGSSFAAVEDEALRRDLEEYFQRYTGAMQRQGRK